MTHATDRDLVDVCNEADLWDGDLQAFDVGEHEVLVVLIDGELHAYDGICPHQAVSLVEGSLEGKVLTCRAHMWQFDVCTGRGINPASARLKRFPISVVSGRVLIGLNAIDVQVDS
jgi:toluene monooxygenase system ferredoxin subunit